MSYYLIVYYEHYRYLVTRLTYSELFYCTRFQTTCLREECFVGKHFDLCYLPLLQLTLSVICAL